MRRIRVFDTALKRWFWDAAPTEGGGSGETPTLAEVLAEGGDPDGNPITAALTIVPLAGFSSAGLTIDGTLVAPGQIFKLLGIGGDAQLAYDTSGSLYLADVNGDDVLLINPTGTDKSALFSGSVSIDSTSIDDAALRVMAPEGLENVNIAVISSHEGGVGGLSVRKDGRVTLDGAGADSVAVEIGASETGALEISDRDFNHVVVRVGPTGALTIHPTDPDAVALSATLAPGDNGYLLKVENTDQIGKMEVSSRGTLELRRDLRGIIGGAPSLRITTFVDENASGIEVFHLAASGALIISPNDDTVSKALAVKHADVGNGYEILSLSDGDDNSALAVSTDGSAGFQLLAPSAVFNIFDVESESARFTVSPTGISFFDAPPVTQPVIPATPTVQDIADILVSLGLATQAA